MVDLDFADTYRLLDPSELRHRIRLLPRHCEDAWRRVEGFAAPWDGESIERVVFGGMGGSAIAGDLVVDLAAQPGGSVRRADVSMAVVRGFEFPDRLDARSLAVLCSYSGNTEETLSLYREARQTAARILVVTAGGKLLKEASAAGIPALEIDAPGEPRSAVGYNLMLLLGAMNGLGLAATTGQEVAQAVAALDRQNARLAEDVPTADNPAKRLATELADKTVIVCGGGTFSGVGRRWKSQLNENAKAWAFFEEVPELLHNTVEAFGNRAGGEQGMAALLLQPRSGNPEMLERPDDSVRNAEAVRAAPPDTGSRRWAATGPGAVHAVVGRLGQLLYGVATGDRSFPDAGHRLGERDAGPNAPRPRRGIRLTRSQLQPAPDRRRARSKMDNWVPSQQPEGY